MRSASRNPGCPPPLQILLLLIIPILIWRLAEIGFDLCALPETDDREEAAGDLFECDSYIIYTGQLLVLRSRKRSGREDGGWRE